MTTGYWTEGKIVNGVNVGGGVFVPTPEETPTPEPTVGSIYKDFKAPTADSEMDSAIGDAASFYKDQYKAPVNENDIRRKTLKMFQEEINATNQIYAEQMRQARIQGLGRLGSNNAIQARSGLSGSDFAVAQNDKIVGDNRSIENSIDAERAAKIASIVEMGNSKAAEEIAAKRKAQQEGLDSYIKYLGTKSERKKASTDKVAQALLDQELSPDEVDPKSLEEIAASHGVTVADLVASYEAKKKEADKAEEEANNKLAKEMSFSLSEGQDRYAYDPKTGTYSRIATKGKTYAPGEGPVGEGNAQLYAGLSSKTATAVRAKVSAFKTEPIVQNFNVVNEGYNFAKSLPADTQNPADDQGLIYAFAKIMDPNSVVREGEYATAQKYAQSWVDAYGKGITQALAGTGFLSAKARENIKKTIEYKYKASETNYNNTYSKYAQGINFLTGRSDGDKFLIDYSTAFDQGDGGSNIVLGPNGEEIELVD